jgi:hypothetical protein
MPGAYREDELSYTGKTLTDKYPVDPLAETKMKENLESKQNKRKEDPLGLYPRLNAKAFLEWFQREWLFVLANFGQDLRRLLKIPVPLLYANQVLASSWTAVIF